MMSIEYYKLRLLFNNRKFLLGLSLFSGITIYFLLSSGPGLSNDSVLYIDISKNIVLGNGMSSKLNSQQSILHSPPMFPLLLSLFEYLGFSALHSARIVNSTCFALSLYLLLIIGLKEKNFLLSPILSLFLFAFSVITLRVFSMVWTEGPFICTFLYSLYFLDKSLDKHSYRDLSFSAIFAAIGIMFRYVGVTVVIATIICILLLDNRKFIKRIISALLFGSISLLPLLIFIGVNAKILLSMAGQTLSFHPFSTGHIRQFIRTFLFIFFPDSIIEKIKISPVFQILLAVMTGVGLIFMLRYFLKHADWSQTCKIVSELDRMCKIMFIFIFSYFTFIIFSISFIDCNTPMSYRILSPVWVALSALIPLAAPHALKFLDMRAKKLISLLAILYIISAIIRAVLFVVDVRVNGLGYSAKKWQNSKILKTIRELSPNIHIYTNDLDAIYYLTGRLERDIPSKTNRNTARSNAEYNHRISQMKYDIENKNGLLVYFNEIPGSEILNVDDLNKLIHLKVLMKDDLGLIYATQSNK